MLISIARAIINDGLAVLWVEHLELHRVESQLKGVVDSFAAFCILSVEAMLLDVLSSCSCDVASRT